MRTHAAVAILPPLFGLGLLALACTEGTTDSTAVVEAGADTTFESSYGGVFVVPDMTGDGPGSGSTGHGESADGARASPCPESDAAPDAQEGGIEDVDAGGAVDGAGEDAACTLPLAPGDLVIDELMIASQSGTGDHGEWAEITSTRSCALNLNGLYAQVPHGQATTTAMVTSDLWLSPYTAFLIADSSNAAVNHDLPGTIVTWGPGTSSDVLKNSGNTITLFTATATIDTLMYTSTAKLVDGASMAFPSNCDPSLRTDFHDWQASLASWTPPPPPPPTLTPCK